MKKNGKKVFFVEVVYDDESTLSFEAMVEGKPHEYMAVLMMVTRGFLMSSGGVQATCYNSEGFDVCSYVK